MARKHPVFDLIKSLDLNEKRYFKLHAGMQKKDSILFRLFNLIAKMREYEESKIYEEFEGEKVLEQLSVTKNHLHLMILKAMRTYHAKWSVDAQLTGLLQDLQFLFEKRLVSQCKLILRKLRRVSEAHGRHGIMLEVLEWESKMLAVEFFVGKDEADIDRISEEYYERLGMLQNEREYQDLQHKLFNNYYKVGIERKNENYKTNDQIVNQFALKQRDRALTPRSQSIYLNIHAQYNKVNGNWEKAYEFRTELKELLQSREKLEQGDYLNIFTATSNLIPIALKLEKYEEVDNLIGELKGLENEKAFKFTKEMEVRVLIQTAMAELALCVHLGRKDEGLAVVDRVVENLDEIMVKGRPFPVLHLYYNVSYFYTSIGEFSPALRWLNKIINDTAIKSIQDLHASTRLLTMILQFELGRSELLEYLARSTNRYLNKLEGLYEFENLMLKFMKKHSRVSFEAELQEHLVQLKNDLDQVSYEPGERNALSTLDLPSWVQSKIENRPMCEVMQERNLTS
ncbi:MAG: hypothetical protein ACI85F_000253 [Bacteroidia bacterium]|jgi:hypothetical protein